LHDANDPQAAERAELIARLRSGHEAVVRSAGLVESVDLDQRSAQPVWVGDERVHQPARWFLLIRLTAIASTNGRLRELFDLAQGGCLVDP
jgi:hypothetical protein